MQDTPRPRARPMLGATVSADVAHAVRARAEREGRPLSNVIESLLRRSLAALGDLAPENDTGGPTIRV